MVLNTKKVLYLEYKGPSGEIPQEVLECCREFGVKLHDAARLGLSYTYRTITSEVDNRVASELELKLQDLKRTTSLSIAIAVDPSFSLVGNYLNQMNQLPKKSNNAIPVTNQ